MDERQSELERFHSLIAEPLHQFLSQAITGDAPPDRERTNRLLETLPSITERELEKLGHRDSACSICMQPFLAILAEEESASVMMSPAFFSEELGVTQLNQPWQCGHLFCKRDITKWIKTGKLTCPMCRKSFLEHGNEPQLQSWGESDPNAEIHVFTTDGNGLVDLEHFLSAQESAQRRDNSGDDSIQHEYSGMYS